MFGITTNCLGDLVGGRLFGLLAHSTCNRRDEVLQSAQGLGASASLPTALGLGRRLFRLLAHRTYNRRDEALRSALPRGSSMRETLSTPCKESVSP